MSAEELVSVDPSELKFSFELNKQICSSLRLTNKTDKHVAFKVKTTNPKKYCVRPNVGVILPRSTFEIIVTMQAPKRAPLDMQCKDKFLIQSVIASQEATQKDITREMFIKETPNVVKECKLRVAYLPLTPSTSTTSQEVFPSNASGKLVSVDPFELKFPFELNKQMSSSLQLTNKTDKHVAFKVKTTDPKKYYVVPINGIVLPQSTCEITVKMQAQKKAPLDMQCKDKFLIQSVIASQEAIQKGITREMFIKESKNVVEECKLKEVYLPSTTSITSTIAQEVFPSNAMVKLVSVNPLELKFPFELNKQMSSSFQLTNNTDKHLAFKVYTTHHEKYCVRPNLGVILPRSTCEIIAMQAQEKAPVDMKCKDIFLIQSVIVSQETTQKDITREMFTKELGNVVDEFKLKVVYVHSTPLTSTIAQGAQEVFPSSTIAQGAIEVLPSNAPGVDNAPVVDMGKSSGIEALRRHFMRFWAKIGQNNEEDEEILKPLLDK